MPDDKKKQALSLDDLHSVQNIWGNRHRAGGFAPTGAAAEAGGIKAAVGAAAGADGSGAAGSDAPTEKVVVLLRGTVEVANQLSQAR